LTVTFSDILQNLPTARADARHREGSFLVG
jgi:hypothetical protein